MFRYTGRRFAPPARPRTSHRAYFEPADRMRPRLACAECDDVLRKVSLPPGPLDRLRTAVMQMFSGRLRAGPELPPDRDERLRNLVASLQGALDELDELGVSRVAIDICEAIERIKLELAAGGGYCDRTENRTD